MDKYTEVWGGLGVFGVFSAAVARVAAVSVSAGAERNVNNPA